jgi:class 3 adenylate cyclase
MLQLAERLREQNGGTLDDSAILAVAEATGAPVDYVRLAVKMRGESEKKRSGLAKIRDAFLTLEPDVRRGVSSAVAGTFAGMLTALEAGTQNLAYDPSAVFGMLKIVAITLGLYNVCISRDARSAAIAGAILGGISFAAYTLFAFVLGLRGIDSSVLIPMTLLGAVAGVALYRTVDRYRASLGLRDPVKERQELLRQLVGIQEKLRSGEQSMTFLSLDIVGSTRMKEFADPLSVEFTFNEYHRFVEMIAKRYGGRVHSTAGDGIICVFDNPHQAFGAARNIQTGIIELNQFRNKIGTPIVLRAGIHSGSVMAASAGDVTSIAFAHVIDIAAHLQKVCPPGGVVVSEGAAWHLPGGTDAVGAERVESQNVAGRIWTPKRLAPADTVGAPPPAP